MSARDESVDSTIRVVICSYKLFEFLLSRYFSQSPPKNRGTQCLSSRVSSHGGYRYKHNLAKEQPSADSWSALGKSLTRFHQYWFTVSTDKVRNQFPYTGINTMVSNKHLSQEGIICQERIRQACWGFNLAVGFVATSSAITLFGFILFLAGQTSKGAYMAAGGLSSTAVGGCCMRLSRDANDRLDKLARELEHDILLSVQRERL